MSIKLIHGDCLEKMRDIPSGSVDMVLTDPPYGTTACKWDTIIPFEPMWNELKRIIKKNGAIVLFGSEPFSSALRMSNIKNYRYDWVWVKNTSTGVFSSKYMPMKNYELLSVFYLISPVYNPQKTKRFSKDSVARYKYKVQSGESNHASCGGSITPKQYNADFVNPRMVIEFKTEPNVKGKFHPTQKPVALMEYLIKTYTNENETVLDFTMGSGTTGVACVNLNRNFIGIEIKQDYFNIAEKRIKEI